MASRSRSRDRSVLDGRSWPRSRSSDRGRSPFLRSLRSRALYPDRRHNYGRDSRSPSLSPRGNNGRYRSRSYSRDRSYDSRSRSRSRSRSPGPPDTGSTKIIVERLSKNVNETDLREIFGQFGEIEDIELPLNNRSGTNRGTAYIVYHHRQDAELAWASMHDGTIDGAVVDVSIVLPRRIFSESPPPARYLAGSDHRNAAPGSRDPSGAPFGVPAPPAGRARRSPGQASGPNRYDRSDTYRPRSTPQSRSRSRSPNPPDSTGRRYRSRSRSYSSRSRSRSLSSARGRRGGGRSRRSYDERDRHRSESRGSYESYGRHSRHSRSRSADWDRR